VEWIRPGAMSRRACDQCPINRRALRNIARVNPEATTGVVDSDLMSEHFQPESNLDSFIWWWGCNCEGCLFRRIGIGGDLHKNRSLVAAVLFIWTSVYPVS